MQDAEPNTKDSIGINSLFVPLDGSEWHERAISYGLLISEWFGSTLDLFFSLADVPPLTRHGEWRQRAHLSVDSGGEVGTHDESMINNGAIHEFGKILANDYLNQITKRLARYRVEVLTDLSAGSPAHILTYKALQAGDSMIVMYARPQHRFHRYMRKKMAEELMSVATVPVLMVNDDPEVDIRDITITPDSVLMPLRLESAMRACLPYAINFARKAGVGIQMVESNVEYKRNERLFDRSRQYTFDVLDLSGVEYSIQAYDMGLTNALGSAHRASPSSWIVMGSRMRYGFTRNFLPSVSDNIRREVTCPVLVVPQAEIIPKRERKLNRWLVERSALADSEFMLHSSRLSNRGRRSGWAQQISSLYTFTDSDVADQLDQSKHSSTD